LNDAHPARWIKSWFVPLLPFDFWRRSSRRPRHPSSSRLMARTTSSSPSLWAAQIAPDGSVTIIVSLKARRTFVHHSAVPVGMSTIYSVMRGNETSTRIFTILPKDVDQNQTYRRGDAVHASPNFGGYRAPRRRSAWLAQASCRLTRICAGFSAVGSATKPICCSKTIAERFCRSSSDAMLDLPHWRSVSTNIRARTSAPHPPLLW